jgi:NADPH-dependent 2,4-dienoyl-CoA reductase/sulfur reductase-like enzyme
MTFRCIIAGGGYSGVLLSELLSEEGFDVVVADQYIRGGEIGLFSRLPVFRDYYNEFIAEYRDMGADFLKAVVRDVEGNERYEVTLLINGMKRREKFDFAFICTGCYDKNYFLSGIYGMRPAGIFSLQNALELIARGYRIGRDVLIFGEDRVLEVLEEMLVKLRYSTNLQGGDEVIVRGRERVESVLIDGEEFRCDTLIYYAGREEFNPFKLPGIKAGNINAKSYDYGNVKEDVLRVFKEFRKKCKV